MLKKIGGAVMVTAAIGWAGVAQAVTPVAVPTTASGTWVYTGPGTLIDLAGDTARSFAGGGIFTIRADDCCIAGDAFGLILDGSSTAWTTMDTTGSVFGPGLFHGEWTGFIGAGIHDFSLEVTTDCCGSGGMEWAISTAVPEPETYAMLLAGLGLLGFVARRRKQKLAAA